jgi:hypothetical protein
MSQLLIQHYLNELSTLHRVSGTSREHPPFRSAQTPLTPQLNGKSQVAVASQSYSSLN